MAETPEQRALRIMELARQATESGDSSSFDDYMAMQQSLQTPEGQANQIMEIAKTGDQSAMDAYLNQAGKENQGWWANTVENAFGAVNPVTGGVLADSPVGPNGADPEQESWEDWTLREGDRMAADYWNNYGQQATDTYRGLGSDIQRNMGTLAEGSINAAQQGAANLQAVGQANNARLSGAGQSYGADLSNLGTSYGSNLTGVAGQARDYATQQAAALNQRANQAQTYGVQQGAGITQSGMQARDYALQKGAQIQQAGTLARDYALKQGQSVQQSGTQARDYALQQGANISQGANQARDYAMQQSNAVRSAGRAGNMALTGYGDMLTGAGDQAANRAAPQLNFGLQNQSLQAAKGGARDLAALEATQGPSAAQAQLQSGLNQSQAANLAMARSGRGWGGGAAALRGAATQNAAAGQNAANASAMLRAQEDAAWRTRNAQNLGAASNIQLGAGQQQFAQQGLQGQQRLQQGAQNDAMQQAMYGQAGQLLGQGANLNLSGAQSAAGIGQQGMGQLLSGQQAAAGVGQQGYGQQIGAAQAGAGIGQQGFGQQIGAAQAGAGVGQQGYGQQIGAAQAGAGVGQAAMGQGLSGAQSAAGIGQQGFGQQLSGVQAGAATDVGARQAGANLAMGGIQAGAGQLYQGTADAVNAQMAGLNQAGNQYMQGFGGGVTAEQAAGVVRGAYDQAQQQTMQNELQSYGISSGVAIGNAQSENQMLGAGIGAVGTTLAALASLSDERAKTDIAPADASALDLLDKAPAYTYRYKDPTMPGAAKGKQLGPMAQDLEKSELGASLVSTGADGYKRVDGARAGLVALGGLSALRKSFRSELDRISSELDSLAKRTSPKRKVA